MIINWAKVCTIVILATVMMNFVFANNSIYMQATTQLAATNFDYVSTFYYNTSVEGFYNFESTPFVVGGGIGQIYGQTDNLYSTNGGIYNSDFNIPYVSVFAGILFNPLPKIKNSTTARFAYSFSGQSSCNSYSGYSCNPSNSSVNLIQIGFRNSTMYFFTSNFYMSFNAGLDINKFQFAPGFSSNPSIQIPNRNYTNPGPNLGISAGIVF